MNNKGLVLITVLWVLVILSLIVWGLGRRSSQEVSVLETYRGKLRSYAAARAGLNTMIDLLHRSPSAKDTLYVTAVSIDQTRKPEDIFAHIDVGPHAYASVQWVARNLSTPDNKPHLEYGLSDEAGRINLNAIGIANYQVLSALFELKGLARLQADELALAIVNYTGAAVQESNSKPKNKPYENVLELFEVNGMTREIFDKIKDDVTVYGDTQNGLWINTDTANNDVIRAVANAAVRVDQSVNAENIISRALGLRDGGDMQSFTPDDGTLSLDASSDPHWPAALQEGRSNYYRARVVGVDTDSGTRTVLEAVIHSPQGAWGEILSWKRD